MSDDGVGPVHGAGRGDSHCALKEVSQNLAPEMILVGMVMLRSQTRD